MPDGKAWPRITVVTPSLNQGRFIEETIRSVLLQGYPDLEYIVVDGGSSDETLEILRRYESVPAMQWICERDEGQAHAIEKGFSRSTGAILAWLNSDDLYVQKGVLCRVATVLAAQPRADIVTAGGVDLREDGSWDRQLSVNVGRLCHRHLRYAPLILQPATFFRRSVAETTAMSRDLHYAFDWDFFLRASKRHGLLGVNETWAGQRIHSGTKTNTGGAARIEELLTVTARGLGRGSWQYLFLRSIATLYRGVQRAPEPVRRPAMKAVVNASRLMGVLTRGHVTPIL
jgi:glycosyltransferase involved in cell wall biosynthesis